jgi:hypothetical protein
MPMRQIRKQSVRHRSRQQRGQQRGGDPGRVALPPAYWGKGVDGYYQEGAPQLAGCSSQVSVSQGVISKDGNWAGPNLYPMLGGSNKRHQRSCSQKRSKRHSKSKSRQQKGGSCGCNSRRKYDHKTMKGGYSKKANRK